MGPDVNLRQILFTGKIKILSVISYLWLYLQLGRSHKPRLAIMFSLILFTLLITAYRSSSTKAHIQPSSSGQARWTYVCDQRQRLCLKQLKNSSSEDSVSEGRCRVSCAPDKNLWPAPNNFHQTTNSFVVLEPESIISVIEAPTSEIKQAVEDNIAWQKNNLPVRRQKTSRSSTAVTRIRVLIRSAVFDIDVDTDERYELTIECSGDDVSDVTIEAETYYGARHGLETLFQLVFYDSVQYQYLLTCSLHITDHPQYQHRGVMLDTARNFITVDMIKTLINSMSYSKMNVFHWHITDSQSFSLYLESLPAMSEYGAYSPEQTYSKHDVEDIVSYANMRGVRVLPEFDSPAHVGAGWEAVDSDLTLCVNREPWEEWCVEPPCGQLNPVMSGLYDVLEMIYRDMFNMFGVKQFHLGGDEIHLGCWNSSQHIVDWLEDRGRGREESDFMFLWNYYIQQSILRIKRAGLEDPRLVYWTNALTKQENIHYLDPSIFTIQIWSNGQDFSDATIKTVAERGFKMIFSNYDATYLDCGFGGWVTSGNNWCSPYKEWQLQHQNDPLRLLEMRGLNNHAQAVDNILGGEVAMWTETVDGENMMSRIEPRAAAYAERLWRGSNTGSWQEAEPRLVRHRERLVTRGVRAETLTHGWCRQNEGKCQKQDYAGFFR